jgi:DNA-binding GntR family transcriptional regulator
VHEVQSINDLIAYAAELRYVAESSTMIVADKTLAHRLGSSPGERWLRIEGFRYREKESTPIAWTEVFIHSDFAGVALNIGRKPGPIYLWIEEMFGQPIRAVRQEITLRSMPPEISSILNVDDESAAIQVMRAYQLASGLTAEVAFTLHPADGFTHSMTLRRVRSTS